jgi:hypothetical protein
MKKDTCSVLGCGLSPSSNGKCWKHQGSSLSEKEPVKDKKKDTSKKYQTKGKKKTKSIKN